MSESWLVAERHEFLPELQPAAQARRCMSHAARPADAGQWASDAEEIRVLSDFQEGDARTLGEHQLEIARFGMTDEHFTDQGGLLSAIEKLTISRLPVPRRTGELVPHGFATCQAGYDKREEKEPFHDMASA
ncbi:MAG: hypothetical protein LC627_02155, partial [Verrucomicrobiaceae bacterium]|nr:hypothetical protein [Verrucomicrobiaceae bacterium]